MMTEYYHNVLIYKSSVRIAIDWYKFGWITFAEFKAMDKRLAEKYGIPKKSVFLEHPFIRDELTEEP